MLYRDADFKRINTAGEMAEFMRLRSLEHGHYSHYSRTERIGSILESGTFWLSQFNSSNDVTERKFPRNKFMLCFASGTTENLPLWYLYSGIEGRGARITLAKGSFQSLVKNATYSLQTFEKDADGKGHLGEAVDVTDMVHVEQRDIFYSSRDRIKYNGRQRFSEPKQDDLEPLIEKYRVYNPEFCKELIWFYEKETRWIVTLPGDKLRLDDTKDYKITAGIPESIYRYIRVRLAPEFESEEERLEVRAKAGFQKLPDNAVEFSDYKGQIKLGLVQRA